MANFPPYMPPQQQMYPNYMQPQYQQAPQQMQQAEMFIVRIASSREEAVATPGDYFKTTIILGLNHGMVYIKRFNSETGSMDFDYYRFSPETENTPKYLTVEEFNEFKTQMELWLKKISEYRKTQEVAESE